MRSLLALCLVGALLAGCLDEEPVVDDVEVPEPAPVLSRVPIDVQGNAGGPCLAICFGGPGTTDVGVGANRTLVGLDVVVDWDDAGAGAPQLRASVSCVTSDRACPSGELASAEGQPPLRLEATGLDVPNGSALRFEVEVLEERPTAILEGYTLQGFLVVLDAAAEPMAETCYEDGHEGHEHAETECCAKGGGQGDPPANQNSTENGTHNQTENGTHGPGNESGPNGTTTNDGGDGACASDERDPGFRARPDLLSDRSHRP